MSTAITQSINDAIDILLDAYMEAIQDGADPVSPKGEELSLDMLNGAIEHLGKATHCNQCAESSTECKCSWLNEGWNRYDSKGE